MSQFDHSSAAALDAAIIKQYEQHLNPSLAALIKFTGIDSTEATARGCIVTDSRGQEYLDCLGGYGTVSVGHSHPRVVSAAKAQLDRMAFPSRLLFSAEQTRLAVKLAEISPGALQYCFFCNSGTEAIEGAVKIARMSTGRTRIVSATGAFHGKTLGSLSVSGREAFRAPFQPLLPDCTQVPYNDAAALAAAVDGDVAAVIMEPLQGEGGIIIPDDHYLRSARKICDDHGALLIADEVQTGLGRTGRMWGCDWSGVAPDLMTLAKALSGGCVPIGAILGTAQTWKIWDENPLIHSSTFGGNPLACAVALTTIEVIEEEGLVEKSARQGEALMARLRQTRQKHPALLLEVRGRGLMIGVQFSHADVGKLVIAGLAQRHVLAAYTFNNPTVMRFEPPLCISDSEVAQAADAFDQAVAQAAELLEGIDLDEF